MTTLIGHPTYGSRRGEQSLHPLGWMQQALKDLNWTLKAERTPFKVLDYG